MKKLVITALLSAMAMNVQAFGMKDAANWAKGAAGLGLLKAGQVGCKAAGSYAPQGNYQTAAVLAGAGALMYAMKDETPVTEFVSKKLVDIDNCPIGRTIVNGVTAAALTALGGKLIGPSMFQAGSWMPDTNALGKGVAVVGGSYVAYRIVGWAYAQVTSPKAAKQS